MVFATPGLRQDAGPEGWREHRFGLSPARWQRLSGRVFWVTGAGTGFGQAIAIGLALAGGVVFLSGRRRAKLAETAERARLLGAAAEACVPLPCDLTIEAEVVAAVREIAAATGAPPYGLVHCAALPSAGQQWPLRDLELARWEALFRLNLTAPWLAARAALADLPEGGEARIVLLSSEAGWAWTPSVGPYNVSKAALNNLGLSLAGEYAASRPDADIQINVLVPGEARTEMNQGSPDSPFTAVAMTLLLLSQPAGGPNGFLFHRDGRHLPFGHRAAYHQPL
jgi:NAD(P)-dependent dehydrogenase (short-subunit alcohol dehydrogenase family)